MIILQVLKLGVAIPARTLIFAWVFYAIAVVRAAEVLSAKHAFAGRMACNAALLIVGSFLLQSYKQMNQYRDWQFETREISKRIDGKSGPIFATGQPMLLSSAMRAGIQSDLAFQFRLQQLGGRDVIICSTDESLCKDVMDAAETPASLPAITKIEGGTLVHFPDK